MIILVGMVISGLSLVNTCAGAEIPVNLREHVQEAVRCVKSLPKPDRDAWLCQAAELLFCQDGRSVYTGKTGSELATIKKGRKVEKHRVTFKVIRHEAVFVGSNGKLYNYRALCSEHTGGAKTIERWKQARYHSNKAGVKHVLAAFASEVAGLKQKREIYLIQHPKN